MSNIRPSRAIRICFTAVVFLATTLKGITETFTTEDPSGNLQGDPSRTYLDIVQSNIEKSETHWNILIKTEKPLPRKTYFLGLGVRYEVRFLVSLEQPAVVTFFLHYNEDGWNTDVDFDNQSYPDLQVSQSFDLTHFSNTIKLSIPAFSDSPDISFVQITSSTAPWPKWKPITSHPVLTISVESNKEASPD